MVRTTIETEPRVRVDYVSVVDAETLEQLDKLDERPILIAVAAYVGKTRLIDNTMLNKTKKDAATSESLVSLIASLELLCPYLPLLESTHVM